MVGHRILTTCPRSKQEETNCITHGREVFPHMCWPWNEETLSVISWATGRDRAAHTVPRQMRVRQKFLSLCGSPQEIHLYEPTSSLMMWGEPPEVLPADTPLASAYALFSRNVIALAVTKEYASPHLSSRATDIVQQTPEHLAPSSLATKGR